MDEDARKIGIDGETYYESAPVVKAAGYLHSRRGSCLPSYDRRVELVLEARRRVREGR